MPLSDRARAAVAREVAAFGGANVVAMSLEVVGEGVVGEHPYLRPGEAFQYTSSTMIETPVGSMHGSYQMVADDGVPFDAHIAPFSLAIPRKLH